MRTKFSMEKVLRQSSLAGIFGLYIILINVYGTFFFILSFSDANAIYRESGKITMDFAGYIDSIYFSFVTSTSLGYGDITPLGLSRMLSILEALTSLIMFGAIISKVLSGNQEKILEELYDVSFQERFTRIISGLYNFRAEIDRIMSKSQNLKKEETEELMQGVEYNLHLLSSYLADSEKILPDIKKNLKKSPDLKEDLILESIHNSISKLEEILVMFKKRNINYRRKAIIHNTKMIVDSTENICKKCINLGFQNIHEIAKEVEKHSTQLKKSI